jgi:hypothetical protein
MNWLSAHRNLKIEDMRAPRLSAPRGARRVSSVFLKYVIDSPRGAPSGAAVFIANN